MTYIDNPIDGRCLIENGDLVLRIKLTSLIDLAKEASKLRLTKRQKQVIGLLLEDPGITNKEIGNSLNVSERTIKYHLTDIMDLVGFRSREEVVKYFDSFETLP